MTNIEKMKVKIILADKTYGIYEKIVDRYKFEEDKLKAIELYLTQQKTSAYTCMNVGICEATLYNWMNEVLLLAYKWAKELKVI